MTKEKLIHIIRQELKKKDLGCTYGQYFMEAANSVLDGMALTMPQDEDESKIWMEKVRIVLEDLARDLRPEMAEEQNGLEA